MCCDRINDIALSGADIYAGGWFATAGGAPTNRIAKWNGTSWSPLGSGTNGGVSAIAVHGADVFVGGDSTTAGCHVSAYFGRYSLLSATEVSVSGRVTTPDGRGLRNATVSMTDSLGVRRIVTTSSFGFYSFDNVATGGNYTMGVQSRLFRFGSRTVQVEAALTNVDFVGLE